MYRIDNTSAVPTLPVAGPPGTPGFFTDGNPAAALEATIVDAWWANSVQEEILYVITQAGIPPNKFSNTQLYQALNQLYASTGGNFLPIAGGVMTGFITLHAPPALPMHAANKQYVDDEVNKAMSASGYVPEAPNDPFVYVRGQIAWHRGVAWTDLAGYLPLTGGTLTTPGGSNPLQIYADGALGQSAMIDYTVGGQRTWYAGAAVDGTYRISDGTAYQDRLWIDAWGTVLTGSHLTVSGTLTVNGTSGIVAPYGNIFAGGGITAQYGTLYVGSTGYFGNKVTVNWGGITINGGDALGNALSIASGNSWMQNDLAVYGGLTVTGTIVGNGASGVIAQYGNVWAWGSVTAQNGNLYVGGTSYLTGAVTIASWLSVGGSSYLGTGTDHNTYIAWDCNVVAGFYVGASPAAATIAIRAGTESGGSGIPIIEVRNGPGGPGQAFKPGGGPWSDTYSDRRVKRDVVPYERSLAAICALTPCAYRFNGLGGVFDNGAVYHGLVAQDVQDIMPEMIRSRRARLHDDDPDETDILTLDTTALTYALVNACKELTARLEKIERKMYDD